MAKSKASKATDVAEMAANNPYVQRLVQDEDLRDNAVVAFEAARDAYNRLNSGKAPQKQIVSDKKLHKDLKRSADALKDAAIALKEGPARKKKRSGGIGKLLLLAIVGAIVALVASEGLRNKVLDALFGAEEEFDYTANAAPPSPVPPAQPVS